MASASTATPAEPRWVTPVRSTVKSAAPERLAEVMCRASVGGCRRVDVSGHHGSSILVDADAEVGRRCLRVRWENQLFRYPYLPVRRRSNAVRAALSSVGGYLVLSG